MKVFKSLAQESLIDGVGEQPGCGHFSALAGGSACLLFAACSGLVGGGSSTIACGHMCQQTDTCLFGKQSVIIEGKARMSLFFLTDFVFLKVDLDKLILLSENKVQSFFFFPFLLM